MTALAVAALLCAAIPAILFCLNLRQYVPPPTPGAPCQTVPSSDMGLLTGTLPAISVLIPARNEASGISDAIHAALASTGIAFEIIIMDDSSTDATPDIVRTLAAQHPNLRLELAPPLPSGWNGKQHACWALAHAARNPLLCFVDADVRLAPEALVRMAAFLQSSNSALVSGFPRQITETWLERLLLPLIHFVLLGFLPLARMRSTNAAGKPDPALAAGCGQFLLVDRAAYFAAGGHAAIRATMHDGLLLSRLLRRQGYPTDLADITDLATCRMYTTAAQVWEGLAKNATEGIGAPARIVPVTLILLLGQVVPFLLLLHVPDLILLHAMEFYARPRPVTWTPAIPTHIWIIAICSVLAVLLAYLPRLLAVRQFRQPLLSALLHPIGILVLLAIQWYALLRKLTGKPVTWRSRAYSE